MHFGETHEDVASVIYNIGQVHDSSGNFEDAMLYYGNAYRIYNRCGRRRHDKSCRRIVEALRKTVINSNGQVGVWDTFVSTGDYMLIMERMILDLVEFLRAYIMEPTRTMIKGSFFSTMKQITELAGQQARISKSEANKYHKAISDYGGLLEE